MEYQNYEEYMRRVLGYSSQDPNIYEMYHYRDNNLYDSTYDRNECATSLTEEQGEELYPEIYRLVNPMVCSLCNSNTKPITKELLEEMTDEICNKIGENETIVNVRIETPKEQNRNSSENNRGVETKIERPISKLEEIRSNREARASRDIRISREMRTGTENSLESARREARGKIASVENREIKTNRENAQNARSKGGETRESIESIANSNRQENNYAENREVRESRRPNQNLRDLIKILILKQLLGGGNRPPVRPPRPLFPGGPGTMPPPRPPYLGGRPPVGGIPNTPPRPRDYEDYLKF